MYDAYGYYFDIGEQNGEYVCLDEYGDYDGKPDLYQLYVWDCGLERFDGFEGYLSWIESEETTLDVFDDEATVKHYAECPGTWDACDTGQKFKSEIDSLMNRYGSLYQREVVEWLGLHWRFYYQGLVENDVMPAAARNDFSNFSFGINTDNFFCGDYTPQLFVDCQHDADDRSETTGLVELDGIFDDDYFYSQIKDLVFNLVIDSPEIAVMFSDLPTDLQNELVNGYFEVYNDRDATQYLRIAELVLNNGLPVEIASGQGSLFEAACLQLGVYDADSAYHYLSVKGPLDDLIA